MSALCGATKLFEESILRKNVGLIDLVQMYPSMQIPFETLVQKCDTIMPRYYTIASSCIVAPKEIKIAISLSKFDTPHQENRLGLVSAYCELMSTDQSIKPRIFVKDSNFNMNNEAPLLMVGPGTGIVPFIAFSDERKHLKDAGSPIAEGHLYFGCRDVDNDFIYRDYLASMVD